MDSDIIHTSKYDATISTTRNISDWSTMATKTSLLCMLLSAMAFSNKAYAQSNSGSVPITMLRTGWASDTFAIETGQAITNPARCSAPDAYMAAISEPGYKTHYAAALLAFSAGKNVVVIVSDTECSGSRPKIIGLHIPK